MNWIQDVLPKLELSLSNGFNWRSGLVLVYHEIEGRQMAELYAGESKQDLWWAFRHHPALYKQPLNSVWGWLPIDTLPNKPEGLANWQGTSPVDMKPVR